MPLPLDLVINERYGTESLNQLSRKRKVSEQMVRKIEKEPDLEETRLNMEVA